MNHTTITYRLAAAFTVVSFLLVGISACSKADKHHIDHYYSKSEQDTLMANIVTHIYKVPRGVRKQDKHDPKYRHLYLGEINKFEFVNYLVDEDSTHFFFLIRPARNAHGHKRGVGGKYKLGEDMTLLDFEEIFNTPMMPEEEIREKGRYLWADIVRFKHVDRYFLNKPYIEFPDERTRYDKAKKEWTYEKLTAPEEEEI